MRINNDIQCHVFIQWIADKGVLVQWMDLTVTHLDITEWRLYIDAHDIVNGLFNWDTTPEGYTFWADIAEDWYEVMEAINE